MQRLPRDLEHTLLAWMRRVGADTYCYVRQVFPGDTPDEHAHRRNCRILVHKGFLEPERSEDLPQGKRKLSMDQMMNRRFRPTL
jgi:hypothetical protein